MPEKLGNGNIVLTGFMGTGKTAVSRTLARLTGRRLVDMDEEIERREGMKIKDIFEQYGEPYFRDSETRTARELGTPASSIISTGGGVVLREENMEALKGGGMVVCLMASPETIYERTSHSTDRPLLRVEDPMAKIRELLAERKPYYERADITIDTDDKSIEEVAEEILERTGWKKR